MVLTNCFMRTNVLGNVHFIVLVVVVVFMFLVELCPFRYSTKCKKHKITERIAFKWRG